MDTAKFETWLTERRGLAPESAREYAGHVRLAHTRYRSPVARLIDRDLAPKTRRLAQAALRAWGRFREDVELLEAIGEIKLPPNQRATAKQPFDRKTWAVLQAAIREAEYLAPPLQAVLAIVAERGLRVGDVLRMKRGEVLAGIRGDVLALEGKTGRRLEFSSKLLKPWLEVFVAANRDWQRVRDLIAPLAKDRQRQARLRVIRALKRIARDLEIEGVHLHRFRRTLAVAFYDEADHDLVRLQKFMQWSNVATAALYTDHVERERLDEIEARLSKKR